MKKLYLVAAFALLSASVHAQQPKSEPELKTEVIEPATKKKIRQDIRERHAQQKLELRKAKREVARRLKRKKRESPAK